MTSSHKRGKNTKSLLLKYANRLKLSFYFHRGGLPFFIISGTHKLTQKESPYQKRIGIKLKTQFKIKS